MLRDHKGFHNSSHNPPQKQKETMFNFIAYYAALMLMLLMLLGCTTTQTIRDDVRQAPMQDLGGIELLHDVMISEAYEGEIKFDIDYLNDKVGAFARYDNRTIYFTNGMVEMYRDGGITKDQMMWLIGHEIGHFNPRAVQMRGTMEAEQFCDYYSLFLMEEMRSLGYDVDPLKAISFLKIVPGKGDSLHLHPAQRYADLLTVINGWNINKE